MKRFTFENQKLEPDYIAFKFEALDWFNEEDILDYLFEIGFNTYTGLPSKATEIREIRVDTKNKFETYFTRDMPHWPGKVFHFTGKNGKYFYDLLKGMVIEWKFFEDSTLTRFDIYYSRYHKKSDKISVSEFLFRCFEKIQTTPRTVSVEKNTAGLIEKIGHRRSSRYFRIYEDKESKNFLKFEYELKKTTIEKYHILLVENQFEEFEHSLSLDFITQFGKLLPLHYCYLDWLVYKLRPFRKRGKGTKKLPQRALNTDYIIKRSLSTPSERKTFWDLLQFLGYVQELSYQTDYLGDIQYRLVTFPVKNFLQYKNESNNHYQMKKILQFFDELQTNSLIQYFTDNYYRSLITIPDVKVFPGKQSRWTAEVWIAEELFYYAHPFLFPDFFQKKLTKHQFEVQFHVIQIFASKDLEKVFFIKDYFKNYPSTLNNSQKTKIKNYFIEVIQILKEYDLIDNNYKLIQDGRIIDTKKLTSKNINEGFIICEKLYI